MDSLRLLIKEILAGKTRLFLTIFAIAWATATISFMLAVGEGLRLTFGKTSSSLGKDFIVVFGGQTSSTQQGRTPNQAVKLTQQDLDHIKQGIPHVVVLPEYRFPASIHYQGELMKKTINGVYPEYASFRNLNIQPGGRFINHLDIKLHRRVIVVGTEFIKEIWPNLSAQQVINKSLIIDQKPFKIIGVLTKKPEMGFYQMPDNYLAWIPASTYIVEKNPKDIDIFLLFFQNKLFNHERLKQQLIQLVALNHQLDPQDQSILQIVDVRKAQQETQNTLKGTEIFLAFVGTMTLVVAGVGIANVMFISVRRATREIGIRMAIGAKSWQILWRYTIEALIATGTGGIIGIAVAYLLVWAINQLPLENEMFKYIGKPTPIFSFMVVGIVIITLGIVGLLAGFFPARRAAAINPAEALRYE